MTNGETSERLYRGLWLIRRAEEKIAELYPQQEMRCPVHLCIGQEAIAVGVCDVLRPTDCVFSTHRSHGHYLAKGGNLAAMLGELYGREMGCSGGNGGSMHLIDLAVNFLGAAPILGATCALAVGAAFGWQMRGEDRVTVAFMGDAAVEEGVVYEAMNFAALHQVPVVLVCENNGLSTCSPLSARQPQGRALHELAGAIGLRTASGNGNDVIEVRRVAADAVQHARSGHGPVFLEFSTYRWREHCGPSYDFQLGYRQESELEVFRRNDPIELLRQQMVSAGAWDTAVVERDRAEIERQIERAVAEARSAPFPPIDRLMENEFAA
jgi:pyruvate dehydrogenase E1 component alpha subunit